VRPELRRGAGCGLHALAGQSLADTEDARHLVNPRAIPEGERGPLKHS
jgi:hypothetical protein